MRNNAYAVEAGGMDIVYWYYLYVYKTPGKKPASLVAKVDKYTICRHGHFIEISDINIVTRTIQTREEAEIPFRLFKYPDKIQIWIHAATESPDDGDFRSALGVVILGIQPLPITLSKREVHRDATCPKTAKMGAMISLFNALRTRYKNKLNRNVDIFVGDMLVSSLLNNTRKRSKHADIASMEFHTVQSYSQFRKKFENIRIKIHKAKLGYNWYKNATTIAKDALEGNNAVPQMNDIVKWNPSGLQRIYQQFHPN